MNFGTRVDDKIKIQIKLKRVSSKLRRKAFAEPQWKLYDLITCAGALEISDKQASEVENTSTNVNTVGLIQTRHQQRRKEQHQLNRRAPMFKKSKITAEIVDSSILTQVEQKTARQPSLLGGIAKIKVISSECAERRRQITMVAIVKTKTQESHLHHDLAKRTVISRKHRRIVHRSTSEKVNIHVASTMKIKTMFIKYPASKRKCGPILK